MEGREDGNGLCKKGVNYILYSTEKEKNLCKYTNLEMEEEDCSVDCMVDSIGYVKIDKRSLKKMKGMPCWHDVSKHRKKYKRIS